MKLAHYAVAAAACVLVAIGIAQLMRPRTDRTSAPAPLQATQLSIEPARVVPASDQPKAIVLYLSGQAGWDQHADAVARALAKHGYTVIGIDSPTFLAQLEHADVACIHPVQPLIALAHKLARTKRWAVPVDPVLAGSGLGATITYATIAQAVPGMFLGGISFDYDGFLPGRKPWCSVNGFEAVRIASPIGGWRPGPTRQLPTAWRLLCSEALSEALKKMLAATPNTRMVHTTRAAAGIAAAVAALMSERSTRGSEPPPLTVTATKANGPEFDATTA